MALISPISRKRSSPLPSDDGLEDEPLIKKTRVEPALPQKPPPEVCRPSQAERIPQYDDDPKTLMLRSIAIALQHVGFDGAQPEAMESILAQVDSYTSHFLTKVKMHMYAARRQLPIATDFQTSLIAYDLPASSLQPHLKPPVPYYQTAIHLSAEPFVEKKVYPMTKLLGVELNGETDRLAMKFVPREFPNFPSKHTYKFTEKETLRETDPRKIREEAAKAARQGEEALRRLVNVSKASKEKNVKKSASKDPRSKERHELWESTMSNFMIGKQRHGEVGSQGGNDDDRSMIVNAERQYFRKGSVAKIKASAMPLESGTT
ncbi:transcription factor TFIID complex subunit 8 C-term-domain-containing protein [Amylocarpus encephaloides]|uniref:Transcription initiation factor TFIID subunit 8 n=1 Tax=Amylocarpus encephaloides TaxID=45428 RepID=A0A9P7YBQ4_9HELO|nr:transcription factor TFIID complex subunit 8 C-term-domain-containing protein [Amylocarpus encephaloides]